MSIEELRPSKFTKPFPLTQGILLASSACGDCSAKLLGEIERSARHEGKRQDACHVPRLHSRFTNDANSQEPAIDFIGGLSQSRNPILSDRTPECSTSIQDASVRTLLNTCKQLPIKSWLRAWSSQKQCSLSPWGQ
jgi:hypothetical protein